MKKQSFFLLFVGSLMVAGSFGISRATACQMGDCVNPNNVCNPNETVCAQYGTPAQCTVGVERDRLVVKQPTPGFKFNPVGVKVDGQGTVQQAPCSRKWDCHWDGISGSCVRGDSLGTFDLQNLYDWDWEDVCRFQ